LPVYTSRVARSALRRLGRHGLSLGVLAALALLAIGGRAATAAGRPAALVVLDNFESGVWPTPGLWYLPPDTTPMWWPSTCRAASGQRSLRAFGGPAAQGEVPCSYRPPAGSVDTVYLDVDLRSATLASRVELYFQLWMKMPDSTDGGLFIYLLVPRPAGGFDRVPVFGATGTSGTWAFPARLLDLLALTDITNPSQVYDLRGGRWQLEWSAVAPAGMPSDGGIYIDDVALLWEPDAALGTPTPRPTLTATPTLTVTPTASATATPRPTNTATATPTVPPVVFHPVFLPYLGNELQLLPSPTPPPDPSATVTPDLTAVPFPSATHAFPSPQPSATPGGGAGEALDVAQVGGYHLRYEHP
jgi:hypothetical protein